MSNHDKFILHIKLIAYKICKKNSVDQNICAGSLKGELIEAQYKQNIFGKFSSKLA